MIGALVTSLDHFHQIHKSSAGFESACGLATGCVRLQPSPPSRGTNRGILDGTVWSTQPRPSLLIHVASMGSRCVSETLSSAALAESRQRNAFRSENWASAHITCSSRQPASNLWEARQRTRFGERLFIALLLV